MKERPILMSGPMVRACMRDVDPKTQTRRTRSLEHINRFPNSWAVVDLRDELNGRPGMWAGFGNPEDPIYFRCSYGRPGDLLVLVCQWAAEKEYDRLPPSRLPRDVKIWTLFEGEDKPAWCGRTRSARFIPKWLYGRFPKVPITDVRVQRVQEISAEDVMAEGLLYKATTGDVKWWVSKNNQYCGAIQKFSEIWDSLNAKRGYSWESNPWVWVLEFERCPI